MEMADRTRTEKIIQILEVANGYGDDNGEEGITMTKLMHMVFLENAQLQEYLLLLIADGLLSYDSPMHTFKTTKKGHTFLQAYNQIDRMLKDKQI